MSLQEYYEDTLREVKRNLTKEEILYYPQQIVIKKVKEIIIPCNFNYFCKGEDDIDFHRTDFTLIAIFRYVAKTIFENKNEYKIVSVIEKIAWIDRIEGFWFQCLSLSQKSLDFRKNLKIDIDIETLQKEKKRLISLLNK